MADCCKGEKYGKGLLVDARETLKSKVMKRNKRQTLMKKRGPRKNLSQGMMRRVLYLW
jgi:hypothetical protein